ncbi:hypothetical protein DPMN_114275 [Dreissena polymorpha]|uniref:Uncharacterized protein n=1 Tax=Dreissena polymorpha TaxID=45954 RepID=A0A9D4KJT1_DREPO|nr:hypothetical protein DPMN_114275 [Dreissena polymorpha]
MCHKLIRKKRSTNSNTTNVIVVGRTKLTASEEILQGSRHFEDMATPNQDNNYDPFNYEKTKQHIAAFFYYKEVRTAISNMNNINAPDLMGFPPEDFKLGGPALTSGLVNIIKIIFQQKNITNSL